MVQDTMQWIVQLRTVGHDLAKLNEYFGLLTLRTDIWALATTWAEIFAGTTIRKKMEIHMKQRLARDCTQGERQACLHINNYNQCYLKAT